MYGREPTGAGTKVLNTAKNSTGIGTPKAIETADTIRTNYQLRQKGQRLAKASASYSPKVQNLEDWKRVGTNKQNTPTGSQLRQRGPKLAGSMSAKRKKAWDRYSPEHYAQTDAAKATGLRRKGAELAVRAGGSGAMTPPQRKEFPKMYNDTKLYESAGMTTGTSPSGVAGGLSLNTRRRRTGRFRRVIQLGKY